MSKFKENTLKSKLGKRIHRRIVVSGLLKASAVALLGWHIRKLQIEEALLDYETAVSDDIWCSNPGIEKFITRELAG